MRGFQEVFPRRRDRHISRTCGELAEPGREEGPGDASREAARSEPAPSGRRRAARGRKPPSGSRARWRERRGSRGTLADGDCGGEPHSLMGAARGRAVSASGSSGGHGALAGGAAQATGRHARWRARAGGARWPGLDTAGEGHQTAHLRHIREGRWRKMTVWCQQSNASPWPTWPFLGFYSPEWILETALKHQTACMRRKCFAPCRKRVVWCSSPNCEPRGASVPCGCRPCGH